MFFLFNRSCIYVGIFCIHRNLNFQTLKVAASFYYTFSLFHCFLNSMRTEGQGEVALGSQLSASRYDRVVCLVAPLFILSQYALYRICRHYIPRPKLSAEAVKHHGKGSELTEKQWEQVWKDMSNQLWCCCFHISFSSVAVYCAYSYVNGQISLERSAQP